MVHQTVLASNPSPTLVGAFLAMMFGAPVAYRVLDRIMGKKEDDK